jgi:outer membrane protein
MQVPLPVGDTWVVFPQGSSVNVQGVSGLRLMILRLMTMTILLADLLLASSAPAQTAPASPEYPWHGSAEFSMKGDAGRVADSRFAADQSKTYSLSELIDLAKANNPATRSSLGSTLALARRPWDYPKLYPPLAAAALSQTESGHAFFRNRFFGQTTQTFELALDLSYTLFDFGARSGRIDAASAQLLSSNFASNDTHRIVIYQVE